jgi:hypothetical protein
MIRKADPSISKASRSCQLAVLQTEVTEGTMVALSHPHFQPQAAIMGDQYR